MLEAKEYIKKIITVVRYFSYIFVLPVIAHIIYHWGFINGVKSVSITSDKIVDNDNKKKLQAHQNTLVYAKNHKGGVAK